MKMRGTRTAARSMVFAGLLLGLTSCAASTARAPVTAVPPNENTDLADLPRSAIDVGAEVREYVVPFDLAVIPEPAALQLKFEAIRGGWCSITYRPTTVTLNGRSLAVIDFRTLTRNQATDLRLAIPSGALKTGENVLHIRTGSCQYDIDVMRLNALTLLQK